MLKTTMVVVHSNYKTAAKIVTAWLAICLLLWYSLQSNHKDLQKISVSICRAYSRLTGAACSANLIYSYGSGESTLYAKSAFAETSVQSLKRFPIFGRKAKSFVNPKKLSESVGLNDIPVVTAASANHFNELKKMIGSSQKTLPGAKTIVFDVGLKEGQIAELKSFCNVEYRKFDFENYPGYFRKLRSYRFKPIIYSKILSEGNAPIFWWADASVRWMTDMSLWYNETLRGLLHQIILGHRAPIVMFKRSEHSNFATTDPGMLDYLPTDIAKQKEISQYGTNIFLITALSIDKILKWDVLCAFEEECMAPFESKRTCVFFLGRWNYQTCHRFDQSAINILLANHVDFQESLYTGPQDFFTISRDTSGSSDPQICTSAGNK